MNNMKLRKLLLKIGISSNVQSFHFILEAYNIIQKQQIHTNMTTIYKMLAKKFDKNPSSIERGIRHGIHQSWKTGRLNKVYYEIPDNSAFLYDLYFNFDILEDAIKED